MKRGSSKRVAAGAALFLLLLVVLILASRVLDPQGGTRPSRETPVPFFSGVEAEVVKVVDGDTLDVEAEDARGKRVRERVRMLRIDTPEREERGYREATRALARMVEDKRVRLEGEAGGRFERGNYGRVLAYVFADGKNVNVEMVRLGWTPFWTRFGEGRFAEAFREAEKEAKRARRGLWRR